MWIKFNVILVAKTFHIQFLVLYLHRQKIFINSQKNHFMKKLIVLAFFAFAVSSTSIAQIELKINPVGALFNNPDIVGEYLVNEDIGIEVGLGFVYGSSAIDFGEDLKRSGFSFLVAGKYYFSPDDGCDKFYAGAYLRPRTLTYKDNDTSDNFDYGYKQSAFGVGLMTGYKWVGARGIIFEIGFGLGRAFGAKNTYNDNSNTYEIPSLGIDGFGRLAVGYRFGGSN